MAHLAWSSASTSDSICNALRNTYHGNRHGRRRSVDAQAVLSTPGSSPPDTQQMMPRPLPIASPYPSVDMAQMFTKVKASLRNAWANHYGAVQSIPMLNGFLESVAIVRSRLTSKLSYPSYLGSYGLQWTSIKTAPFEAAIGSPAISTTEDARRNASLMSQLFNQPLLMPFLERADRLEVQYAYLMADLSNMAYEAHKVESEMLADRHHLVLVSSSSMPVLGAATREAQWELVRAAHHAGLTSERMQQIQGEAAAAVREQPQMELLDLMDDIAISTNGGLLAPLTTTAGYSLLLDSIEEALSDDEDPMSHTRAARGARSAMQHILSHQHHDSMLLKSSAGGSADASMSQVVVASTLHGASPAVVVAAAGTEECSGPSPPTAWQAPLSLPPSTAAADPDGPPVSMQSGSLLIKAGPPAAWFVADNPETKVRYFVFQGSTSLEHWTINVKFDPVIFEDPSLGVHVHRGVYEAALSMYEDLLPLVQQHLALAGPSATISLTGHSLGGSLSSMLLLMMVHRGALTPADLSPCYSFGAPAVFCSGGAASVLSADGSQTGSSEAHRCDSCQLGCDERVRAAEQEQDSIELAAAAVNAAAGDDASSLPCLRRLSVLERLGIPEDMLHNIMMHKDIVPRAFVCDYTLVADLLKSWRASFKEHKTLSHELVHKNMYNFIGRVVVLRPDNGAPFVDDDNHHPMLPDEPGLYKLREPPQQQQGDMTLFGSAVRKVVSGLHPTDPREPERNGSAMPGEAVAPALTLGSALLQFMNYPHPLQTLGQVASYGHQGAISRFHNPDNYTKGLRRLSDLI